MRIWENTKEKYLQIGGESNPFEMWRSLFRQNKKTRENILELDSSALFPPLSSSEINIDFAGRVCRAHKLSADMS